MNWQKDAGQICRIGNRPNYVLCSLQTLYMELLAETSSALWRLIYNVSTQRSNLFIQFTYGTIVIIIIIILTC